MHKFYLTVISILIIVVGYFVLIDKNSTKQPALIASVTPTPTNADTNATSLKTFKFTSFHGSSDISDKFQFQYPANWVNDGQYFSPEKIQYYNQFTARAPVYFDLILADVFNQTELGYELDNDKRLVPDSTGKIDGRDFKKYVLMDYGSYGGESSGKVVIFVGPQITIDGNKYYLVFHWEEKPLALPMGGNDLKIFEQMMLTLKFY